MPERRLVSLPEAAELLDVDPITLRRWGAKGRLKLYRIGPRMLRVDANEVEALARPVPTTDPAA